MADIINHTESGNWITIKDASDLLGVSERHAWNIITKKGIETKKLLNKHRKKTYVLQADIEQYHRDEQERQRLEALKPDPLSEMSERNSEIEMSERLSESQRPLSESGLALINKPKALLEMVRSVQTENKSLHKRVVKWRVTSFWLGVLGVIVVLMMIYYITDISKALSEMSETLSERDRAISESQKALSEMSERALTLSEREKQALSNLYEQGIYTKELENRITELEKGQTNEN